VVVIFFILLVLPADSESVRSGRSIFFLVGALFSALTGFTQHADGARQRSGGGRGP